jgi:hypothetical protein
MILDNFLRKSETSQFHAISISYKRLKHCRKHKLGLKELQDDAEKVDLEYLETKSVSAHVQVIYSCLN